MTDAESVARGIADRWTCIGEDRAVKFLIKEIATALRDRYDAGYADACRIVHDRADAEGYRRGYEEGSEFQMKMRIRDATERNQEPKCDGECGKECKTCWPTQETRAEKILAVARMAHPTSKSLDEALVSIRTELDAAVREAEEPWKILCENQLVGLKVASECERIGDEIAHKLCEQDCECSKKGFAAAREKAAGIVKKSEQGMWLDIIAERIMAMAPEEGK